VVNSSYQSTLPRSELSSAIASLLAGAEVGRCELISVPASRWDRREGRARLGCRVMPPFRTATTADLPLLVELMAEFYAESGYPLDRQRAGTAFADLLADPNLGRVWLIVPADEPVGYVALTLGYSLEYGGRDAFLDDLYVRPAHRGKGLGKLALATVRAACEEHGVRALHLEAERDNAAAQLLYRGAGFRDNGRQLLTLRLREPLHEGEASSPPSPPSSPRDEGG
jgi:diamine N-acetyltransferase